MADQAEEYLNASNWAVEIDGLNWNSFEKISGLGDSFEDISLQHKDKNTIMNRPGRYNAFDISLTRRFKKDKELSEWRKQIQEGKDIRKSGSVILKDEEANEVMRFNFFGAWPKSYHAPVLDKNPGNNDTPMETIVLSVQEMEMA